MKRTIITIFLVAIAITPFWEASSQIATPTTLDILVEVSPKFPEPLSRVKVSAKTFTFDLNRASVRWLLNGRTLAEGTGIKEVSFDIGPIGSVSNLQIIASPQEGGLVEKSIQIRPQAIDLLVESSSFAPFWYKGARLVTPLSEVKVVAIPNFIFQNSALDPKDLIYEWKINNAVRGDLSGTGKQSISFRAPGTSRSTTNISLNVSSQGGTLASGAETSIVTRNPELLFYERRPLEGLISSEAISQRIIKSGSEIETEAIPFFMNFRTFSELSFNWTFAGNRIEADPKDPNAFLVKSEEGTAGQALLSLVVRNLKNILEEVSGTLNVIVEK
jgi:hypothetical protein